MPSDTSAGTLKSPSYVGLLVAQFLACFNDQAIHYVAFFYAVDMLVRYVGFRYFDVKLLAVIVTSCFIAPFLLFSPLAGVLADKFSKRSTIVFWKFAEVGIMGLVFVGFLLPHIAEPTTANVAWSSAMLLEAVFLMGTHSTFFIPAKYGIMPEILHPSVLSRGNGILEGSSFTGNILGTVFGGLVYVQYHSTYDAQTRQLTLGKEWILGLILLGLAMIGALAALIMPKQPAADPTRKMEWNPWVPVRDNLRVLRRSRPLVLATIGIAFFTFMTLFFRLVLIFEGETNKDYKDYSASYQQRVAMQRVPAAPRSPSEPSGMAAPAIEPRSEPSDPDEGLLDQFFSDDSSPGESFADDISLDDLANRVPSVSAGHPAAQQGPSAATKEEFRIAMLIAFIALGVGAGCTAAGMISGDRIELGLVPFGAALIVLFTALLAYVTGTPWATRVTLVAVGIGAGLYIVPLYTLLQHRAPKESKGNLVALSNFLNVTGGLVAVGVFYFITFGLQRIFGLNLSAKDVAGGSLSKLHDFVIQLQQQTQIPRMLFLAASLITLAMIYLLCRQRPDFLLRMISWFSFPRRRHLHTVGLGHVPSEGHVILATNCHDIDSRVCVMSAIDRRTYDILLEPAASMAMPRKAARLDSLARRLGLAVAPRENPSPADWNSILESGVATLEDGYLVSLAIELPKNPGAVAEPLRAPLPGPISRKPARSADDLYLALQARVPSMVLPVYCDPHWAGPSASAHIHRRALVIIGKPLAPDTPLEEVRTAIRAAAAVGD